jgi:hypothetical protein
MSTTVVLCAPAISTPARSTIAERTGSIHTDTRTLTLVGRERTLRIHLSIKMKG